MSAPAIWFAPLECVIVRKLEYFQSGSDRHIRDIAGILRVSGELVDHGDLQHLLAERKLAAIWQRVADFTP